MAESRSTTFIVNNTLTRRRFIRRASIGAAGAALALRGSGNAFAAGKDSGHITLDALLITYFSPALGTDGTVQFTFRPNYTMTVGLRAVNNPDIALRARVAPADEGVGQGVWQAASQRVAGALTIQPHAPTNESFGITTRPPNLPENTAFYGLFRP